MIKTSRQDKARIRGFGLIERSVKPGQIPDGGMYKRLKQDIDLAISASGGERPVRYEVPNWAYARLLDEGYNSPISILGVPVVNEDV